MFADPKETGLTTAGSLFGNKSKPGRKLPPVLEACPATNKGYQRRGRYRSGPLNLANTLAYVVGLKEVSNALRVSCNTLIQLIELFAHVADQFYEQHRGRRCRW
ncbi:hypothetical protein So717_00950 [Roseobacter cerasinus]|uniref:Uncharacterized protein n=1 Tax=Roseobacter cerasinus TaxID=2602289 RepID=A0A640VKW3_9RHOB|nr:hypothetical protein So717_00950 [Roseobacter cerasinus]